MSFVSEESTPIGVVRIVRLIRIFRIFKLSRYSVGLQVLGLTLKASMNDLFLLALFLALGVIFFSSGIYYVEHDENNLEHFPSIPGAFWYCLVTMTTVGYGDHVPDTPLGKIIGGACVLTGILMVALVIPVIVTNFDHFYKREMLNLEKKQVPASGGMEDNKTCPDPNTPLVIETTV